MIILLSLVCFQPNEKNPKPKQTKNPKKLCEINSKIMLRSVYILGWETEALIFFEVVAVLGLYCFVLHVWILYVNLCCNTFKYKQTFWNMKFGY